MNERMIDVTGLSRAIQEALADHVKDYAQDLAKTMAKEYHTKVEEYLTKLAMSAAIQIETRTTARGLAPNVYIHVFVQEPVEGEKIV